MYYAIVIYITTLLKQVHGWMGGQDVCGSQDDARVKSEGRQR